jgi:hypothetical protein
MRPNPGTEKDKDWLDEREPTATSEPDDFERSLDEDDGVPPESWKPKPGDMIIGVLRRYQKVESQYGPCWIAVLEARNDAGQPYLAAVGGSPRPCSRTSLGNCARRWANAWGSSACPTTPRAISASLFAWTEPPTSRGPTGTRLGARGRHEEEEVARSPRGGTF